MDPKEDLGGLREMKEGREGVRVRRNRKRVGCIGRHRVECVECDA